MSQIPQTWTHCQLLSSSYVKEKDARASGVNPEEVRCSHLGEDFLEPSMKLGKAWHKYFRALMDNTILIQQKMAHSLRPKKRGKSKSGSRPI